MSKPTIFFSHSSKDKEILLQLKELFVDKTGGTIDVFLSSDGQSIPLGRNWVHRVQEALNEALLMIVFITPNSLSSSWIYFETGFAYSKEIRVVPVGFLGTNLASLPPPLGLLQGFNISNQDSLNNLIALANDVFSHSHKLLFSEAEYKDLILQSDVSATHLFGDFVHFIDKIQIDITEKNILSEAKESTTMAKEILDSQKVEYRINKSDLEAFGLTISKRRGDLLFLLDPTLIESTFPIVNEIIGQLLTQGIRNIPVRFDFINRITCISDSHKLTARLFGAGISLGKNDTFIFHDISFSVSAQVNQEIRERVVYRAAKLFVSTDGEKLELEEIVKLMKIIFEKSVFYEIDEWVSDEI